MSFETIDLDAPFEREMIVPGESFPNLTDAKVVSVDVETCPQPEFRQTKKAGLHPWRSHLLGLSVSAPGKSWYVPLRHRAPGSERYNVDEEHALPWLADTMRSSKVVVNHNLKFDLKMLAIAGRMDGHGVDLLDDTLRGVFLYCTYVGANLVDEREEVQTLKFLTAKLLGMPAAEEKVKNRYLREAGQKKDFQDWSVVPADVLAPYACSDTERALKLFAWQFPLIKEQGLEEVLRLEQQVLRVLTRAELTGVRVDVDRLKQDRVRLLRNQVQLEQELEEELGLSINPSSPEELADVVANHLGLPILHHTAPSEQHRYGKPKFDDAALLEYIDQYPAHARKFWLVRKVRRLEKLRSGFVEPYLFHHVDGVVHGNFNSNAAVTGRMTANNPNLQQVSSEERWECETLGQSWTAPGARQYFVPRDDRRLTAWDYSQIEYRMFAHYSKSEKLVTAYREDPNLDMHQWATDVVLQGRLPRKATKNINFGIVYGMGKAKLLRSMQAAGAAMTEAECEQTLNFYYREMPELKELQRAVGETLKRRGFVKTVLGRRRRLSPNWRNKTKADKREDRGLLPYQALNAICQGSATEILKTAMVAASEAGFLPLAPIHDELLLELPQEEGAFQEAARRLKPILERFVERSEETTDETSVLRVPIYVNCKGSSKNWAEAEDLQVPGN